jgi:glutaredoxin
VADTTGPAGDPGEVGEAAAGGGGAMSEPAPARITVVSRVNCHLCEVAKEVVARVAAEAGVAWTEVDVDADPALLAEYSDLVPVVLVDGQVHDYWRVDEARLRRALAAEPGTPPWM